MTPPKVPAASVSIAFPEQRPAGPHLRALREDVDHPYVVIAEGDQYAVIRDEGDLDGAGGVLFVNPFEVPAGEDEAFLAAWDAARPALEARHGFLGRRLHRGGGRFRYVNVGRWSSPLMYARAMADPAVIAAVEAIDFPSHPALYLPAGV